MLAQNGKEQEDYSKASREADVLRTKDAKNKAYGSQKLEESKANNFGLLEYRFMTVEETAELYNQKADTPEAGVDKTAIDQSAGKPEVKKKDSEWRRIVIVVAVLLFAFVVGYYFCS